MHLIFIPIKIRKSIGKKDGCYGYFRVAAIDTYEEGSVTLSSGVKLPYLCLPNTIATKFIHATTLSYFYYLESTAQQDVYYAPQYIPQDFPMNSSYKRAWMIPAYHPTVTE